MDLIARDLAVTLGGRPVLADVNAILRPGRVTVLLGPNGAGKSTLLRALAGLLVPAGGTACLGDRAVASLPPRERGRLIGYLPQAADVHWNIAAGEVVALGRLPHRAPFAALCPADRTAIAAAMTATETEAFADRPVAELSGGERARVLLARVLAGEPRWLLADEPLASLDPAHQVDILDRLAAIAARGSGVVLVLHDLAQAARIAADVLLLRDGRLAAAGPVAQVLTPPRIASVFDVTVATLPGTGIMVPTGRIPR